MLTFPVEARGVERGERPERWSSGGDESGFALDRNDDGRAEVIDRCEVAPEDSPFVFPLGSGDGFASPLFSRSLFDR